MDIIYENDNYVVEIGPSMILEDCKVYLARNRRTGVAEAEDHMLPKIVDYAIQLDEGLQKMEQEGIKLFPYTNVAH